jgi:hypothetical protein
MATVLYNLTEGKIISKFFTPFYTDTDGNRPELPDNIVELDVEQTQQPNTRALSRWEKQDNKWVMVWHTPELVFHINKPIQVCITDSTMQEWNNLLSKGELLKKVNLNPFADLEALVEYVGNISRDSLVYENGTLYIYLDEIYPDHHAILEKYGAEIFEK